MGGFEKRNAVADIAPGRHAQTADLGCGCVAQVIAIQVEGGNHIILTGAREQLLEHVVGDAVFDHHLTLGDLAVVFRPQLILADHLVAEFLLGQLVSPILEGTFGELHDVAFVHQRHAGPTPVPRIRYRLAYQALRPGLCYRFDADGGVHVDIFTQLIIHKVDDPPGAFRVGFPFDAGVDVFGVLPEDDHVHCFGVGHRAGRARQVAHRAHTRIEIQNLA